MRKAPTPSVAPGHCLSRICHLGAVEGDVTGSLHLVELIEHNKVTRILVDVGQTIENPKADFQNRLPNGLTWTDIDMIIITHGHLDHSGLLPLAYKLGYRGKVYVSDATADLLEILLPDSGKIQEADALRETNRQTRKADERAAQLALAAGADEGRLTTRRSKGGAAEGVEAKPTPVQPLYTMADATNSLSLLERMDFCRRYELTRGVTVEFLPASHILGAAMVHLELGWNGERRSIRFAGNIGRREMPLLRAIKYSVPCDYVVMESTYGDRLHQKCDDLDVLSGILNSALERASKPNKVTGYGAIIIPVFSIGRAQVMLDRIRRLKEAGRLPAALKIYFDSPMSIKVTEVHRKPQHRHLLDDETQAIFAGGGDPFKFPGLIEVSEFRKELLEPLDAPCIILCSPGMGNGGRALSHIDLRVESDNNTLLFVGYQGRGTIGNALLAARDSVLEALKKGGTTKRSLVRYVNILGRKKRVNATVEFMPHYSAHGDWLDIVDVLRVIKAQRAPMMVFLEHGDKEAVDALHQRVVQMLSLKVTQPKLKEWFVL